jgi:hypothetical protein
MSTIIPTTGTIDTDAQTKAASRAIPELQPMKVIQIPVPDVSSVTTSVLESGPEQTTKLGGKTMSKKEHEKQLALKEQAEIQRRIAQVSTLDLPPIPLEERNLKSRIPMMTNDQAEFPKEWAGLRRVYRAWLQTPISISGIVSSETTLTPDKLQGLIMALDPADGLLIQYKGIEIFVPAANVKCCVLKER